MINVEEIIENNTDRRFASRTALVGCLDSEIFDDVTLTRTGFELPKNESIEDFCDSERPLSSIDSFETGPFFSCFGAVGVLALVGSSVDKLNENSFRFGALVSLNPVSSIFQSKVGCFVSSFLSSSAALPGSDQ